MPDRTATADINQEFLLAKCEYFVDAHIWPLRHKLDPERWLSNFTAAELDHALHLLNGFIYFSQDLVDQMFLSAFHSICTSLRQPGDSYLATGSQWDRFRHTALVTRVTGESPSDTDSGFHFSRMARRVLGLPEERIMSPEQVLKALLDGGPRDVVFVDDFVGSGSQFLATWRRKYSFAGEPDQSFAAVDAIVRGSRYFYCPILCTMQGRERLERCCPQVVLTPAHFLGERYSPLSPRSYIWPARLLQTARDFIMNASARAGITNWEGFAGLGLAVAFEHCVPDATLPLFYWNQNGWKPLVERT